MSDWNKAGHIELFPSACLRADTGAPLAVFADSAANPSVPGVQILNTKTFPVRWNNAATFTAIARNVVIPNDFDNDYLAIVNLDVSKVGATVGDATTFTIAAYLSGAGQLHDVDTDFGGVTGALVGNLATKTKSLLQLALAAADFKASSVPRGTLTLTIKPTDGTLGTDDICLHGAWLSFRRKEKPVVQNRLGL